MKTMTMPLTTANVRDAFRAAKSKRSQFLDEHGWKVSADFPDKRTRWVKSFNGRELPMTAGSAFALERALE